MSNWDIGSIYYTNGPNEQAHEPTEKELEKRCFNFLKEYREDSTFIYREQMRNNLLISEHVLTIEIRHLQNADPALADDLFQKASDLLPTFESAAKRLAAEMNKGVEEVYEIQVLLKSDLNVTPLRQLTSQSINKLVRISGIVSSASTPTSRATSLHLYCRNCRHVKIMNVKKGFSGVVVPRTCENTDAADHKDCPMDPYVVDHEKTIQIDQQVLKLQESPDTIPVGELPRHTLLTVDRYLTNKVAPGTRVTVLGIYDVFQNSSSKMSDMSIRTPYLSVIGLDVDSDSSNKVKKVFTAEEEALYIDLAKRPNIYQIFSKSVAPSIYGNEDVKRSIACLLMGGSKKVLPDGMRLRGDINVLLLGDPGTAKSQLLKFVEKVSPISVYTSGKGSSAAGLTASVIRDANTGEFYLEGGAMVLADGGVVCIDEFDKMRDDDRVAIHEAMEQQTISIAKAGITTILNSRTSVLAAANPLFGRYDDMRTPGENIDFQTTILSRFDMIYILKDEHIVERDEALARHVLNVHATNNSLATVVGELDLNIMKGFITYCKSKCAPTLNESAKQKLSSHFVEMRSQIQRFESESNSRSSVPITIRQLEAIIRISEAVAKFSLSPAVSEEHVDEAIRLFKVSTYAATKSGYVVGETMMMGKFKKEVMQVQEEVRRRIPQGSRMPESGLLDYLRRKQFSEYSITKALSMLQMRGTITYVNQGHTILRYFLVD